jgi:signal transduction histidine kinase
VKLFRSLSFRLALIYLALFIGSTALLFGAYYYVSISHPRQLVRTQIEREAQALANVYIGYGADELRKELDRRERLGGSRRRFHAFSHRNGETLTATLPSLPARLPGGWGRVEVDVHQDGDEEDHEALITERRFADGSRLIIGRDIEDLGDREEGLAAALAWVLGLSVLLGLAGGLLMSRAIGRRLGLVAGTARQVIEGDLSGRVPLTGSGDEFDRLSRTLNLMLDRNEELIESVRRVSDTVAHELRTPLARLQADIGDLQQTRDGSIKEALLARLGDEAERLQTIFDALLRIARIESGRHLIEERPVRLRSVLEDAAELYSPAAEERQLRLTCRYATDPIVNGDADLIFQGVANLLDNAIKFTPAGGEVRLLLCENEREVLILITDTGPGIAAGHLPRITERFYRAPSAEAVEGSGLGLSLVSAIAKAHGSKLNFQSEDGTCVSWIFQRGPLGRSGLS